jgi:hypothetical protein
MTGVVAISTIARELFSRRDFERQAFQRRP